MQTATDLHHDVAPPRESARPLVAANYYLEPHEMDNRVFNSDNASGKAQLLRAFRAKIRQCGGEVVTLDTVDFNDPQVKHVVYFDYNWRLLASDPFLRRVPFDKRALVLIEPANINPSMYYTAALRDRFHTVFTWDLSLLRRNPAYVRINVPVGAEPAAYRENRFRGITFHEKKCLVAVSKNRWGYMPQSTYTLRKRLYKRLEQALGGQFDLYGPGWNVPAVFYEKWLGHARLNAWRGEITGGYDAKVAKMALYKFALCIENNAREPGYISEKITDCFCARCVPVYYGSRGVEQMIPREAWIDLRDFKDPAALGRFISGMEESEHLKYVAAIDAFMQSDQARFFSTDNFFSAIAAGLGFGGSRRPPAAITP